MSARLDFYLRNTVRTYRVTFADLATSTAGSATGSQIYFEVQGAAGKKVKLRHLQIFKPLVSIAPFRLAQYSVATTGSAGETIISPTRMNNSSGSTYGGTVTFYSTGPTSGAVNAATRLDQGYILDQDISTGDVVNEHFGDERGISCPTLLGSSESWAGIVTSAATVTLNGYIEFTEEP
jgi:hypothetical protein